MKEVEKYLRGVLKNNSSVVVACSGGPDSMCLLHLVLNLKKEKNLNVICAHVNHKMRLESEAEAEFVRDYSKNNGVVFEYMEITDYNDDNFHSQARLKRYDFFKEVINKYKAEYLLTAHHGDDLTETILMRIVRGSNLKGYIGFKKESEYNNYRLIRPLISVTKSDIESFNKEHNIPYVIDYSNEKDKYTRNRYRHTVLPFLKNEDNMVHKKFLKFSEELSEFDEFLANYMSKILTTIIKNDTLDISLFHKESAFIKRKIIEFMIMKIQEVDLFYIEDKHIDLILELTKSKKSNAYIELPNGFVAEKNYNNFKIVKKNEEESYCIKIENEVKLNNGYKLILKENTSDTSNYTTRLNSREITLPLYVRTRVDGDKIAVKNLEGTKKVKDIFINSKVDMPNRKKWPIVVDNNNNVVWIPGLKKSKFDKEKDDIYDIIIRYEEDINE